MKLTSALLLIAAIFLLGCNGSKQAISTQPYEIRVLDTMVVSAAGKNSSTAALPPVYQASETRYYDLLHTTLDISFDWEQEAVIGKANLILIPYFFPTDQLVLDAKGFEIHSLLIGKAGLLANYDYDGQQISIHLDRKYTRNDTLYLEIAYTAYPTSSGGSAAITSDKGLFFINARGDGSGKPRQIWTQGETENNSRWFPTIDKPNERCTGELFITVEDQFITLSNGVLVSSVQNSLGKRTDHWKMDQSHAPYLFMVAVGEYAVVKDQWRDILLEYYVEPEYEAHAKAIFPYTPEMLEFFSNLLDYPYPWPKYSQIVVRDFVSGAMENTTAVVFGDFMYGKERELIDVLVNEKIVAHEMFHHWFGNLVTCESWANLTLNEGFANYSEYLWLEHKHGREEADYNLMFEESEYLYAARSGARPLIHFAYEDRESMFDQHSYNKGGLVLHMLRHYLGDEAFFAGLNRYLTRNAFTEVEVHQLRLAMEEVSGQDLNWFFNQWYLQEGHPSLEIRYGYDAKTSELLVEIKQTQSEIGFPPVFQFPVHIQIFLPGDSIQNEVSWMGEQIKVFRFSVPEQPILVLFDPERVLLAERTDNKSQADLQRQYYLAPSVRDRFEALQALISAGNEQVDLILADALLDSSWAIRFFALDNLETLDGHFPTIAKLASTDPHSHVRGVSCNYLGQSGQIEYAPELARIAREDRSLMVAGTALDALFLISPDEARKLAEELEPDAEGYLIDAIAEIYLQSGNIDKLDFFQKQIDLNVDYGAVFFLAAHVELSRKGTVLQLSSSADYYFSIASQPNVSAIKLFSAVRSLNEIHVELVNRAKISRNTAEKEELQGIDRLVVQMLESVKIANPHDELKAILKNFPDPKAK